MQQVLQLAGKISKLGEVLKFNSLWSIEGIDPEIFCEQSVKSTSFDESTWVPLIMMKILQVI